MLGSNGCLLAEGKTVAGAPQCGLAGSALCQAPRLCNVVGLRQQQLIRGGFLDPECAVLIKDCYLHTSEAQSKK